MATHENTKLNLSRSLNIFSQRPENDEMNYRGQIGEQDRDRDRNSPNSPNTDELIRIASQIRKAKRPKGNVYDSAVESRKEDYKDGVVHVYEALKGADMNPTWKLKIFSQRPEDDDEELRQQIQNKLKYYNPNIADNYRDHERYCILERREYQKDISATDGFEVGYYPYLMRSGDNMIIRYYCPPDVNASDDLLKELYDLATHAIQAYNSKHQTCYSVANVVKTMTAGAAGTWYYMTFQASLPGHGDQLWTFEAKLFESNSWSQPNIKVSLVRLKKEGGSSSLIQEEPYAGSLIQEPYTGALWKGSSNL